jgi:tight adherence protein B
MLIPVLLTFGLVLAIFFGVYWVLVLRPEEATQTALLRRLKVGRLQTTARGEVLAGGLLRTEAPLSGIPGFDTVLRGAAAITRPAHNVIERAGLNMTVGSLLLMCAVTGLAAYAVVHAFTHLTYLSMLLGALATYIPIAVVHFMAKRRVMKFEEQFPEAIDLLSRALKAGHAFTTGLSLVAEEMPDPVGTEFRLAFDRQNFGMPLPDALRSLADRVPLLDAKFFVTAVLTQRDAGGNLAEVLDNLASVIRERFRVKRQVRVVTAHARMTGWVLVGLPPTLGLVLTMLSPEHMSLLWTDPTGVKMIAVALVLQVIGTLVIKKLVDVEY